MPGYDGTGPRGHGPMSGGGRGYCILKNPRTYGDALTGFAGLTGKPVTFSPVSSSDDIASLHFRARQVHLAIQGIHRRITILEAIKQGIGKPRRNAHRRSSRCYARMDAYHDSRGRFRQGRNRQDDVFGKLGEDVWLGGPAAWIATWKNRMAICF